MVKNCPQPLSEECDTMGRQALPSQTWGLISPFNRNPECRYVASSSKDGSVRVWDTTAGRCERILTGHTQSVTCLRWGGDGLLYSASQDRTIKVWRAHDVRAGKIQKLVSWVMDTGAHHKPGISEPGVSRIVLGVQPVLVEQLLSDWYYNVVGVLDCCRTVCHLPHPRRI